MKVKVGSKDETSFSLSIQASSMGLNMQTTFGKKHDSMMWMTPLSDDKSRFFATVKKSGIPLHEFTYTFAG